MRRKIGISTRLAAGALAVAVLGSLGVSTADAGTDPTAAARARASYDAINKYFDAGKGLLLEEYPNTQSNAYSYVWPYSQAAIAAEDLAGVPGAGREGAQEADRRVPAGRDKLEAGERP